MFKRLFGKKDNRTKPASARIDVDEFVRQMAERDGSQERADRLPAWALLLRSPFLATGDATSWFGGYPKAPADFVWPRDPDGAAMHFLIQIDLSSLKEEPTTGQRPPGLPQQGAILFFVGRTCSCHVLSATQMERASDLAPPDDLAPVSQHGYFSEETAFGYWPIDPVAYTDSDGGRPDFLPDRFKRPTDWMTNWGIAALEAELAIEHLERELGFGASFLKLQKERRAAGKPLPETEVVRSKTAHYSLMRDRLPGLLTSMKAWRRTASSNPATDPVDRALLEDIFRSRVALADEMQGYGLKNVLPGNPKEVWTRIMRDHRGTLGDGDHDVLSLAYRPFVEAMITDWRGHRLFGLEMPPPYNDEDLRGRDCLINVSADLLLNTVSEHEYGMSIWCAREEMDKGLHGNGVFLRHGRG
jgi:hypothetical protein